MNGLSSHQTTAETEERRPTVLSLGEIEALGLTDEAGNPLVESVELLPERAIEVEPIAFGDVDLSDRRMVELPSDGSWKETGYRSSPVRLYRISGALVHSDLGIVLLKVKDGCGTDRLCLVAETIQYMDVRHHGVVLDVDAGIVELATQKRSVWQGRAVHLMAGGGANFYHFNIDILSRLSVVPEQYLDDMFFVPPLRCQFQWDLFNTLAPRPMCIRAVEAGETVEVDELVLVPNIGHFGKTPRPEQLSVFSPLAPTLPVERPRRRLYVSRVNAHHRLLMNEQEVIELLRSADYEILECESMSIVGQARAFAEASHIIAPHGAGLTNIIHAGSETSLCELQMDLYVNWLFRRLGNLKGIRYGCVIGDSLFDWDPSSPHNKFWEVDMERLKAVLGEVGFI